MPFSDSTLTSMKKKFLLVLGLFLFGAAFAQSLPTGVPAEYATAVTAIVGLLAGLLVNPLTAIAKRFGCTKGPTTVAVSGALSLLVGYLFTVVTSNAFGQHTSVLQVLLTSLIAFVKANGDYISQVFASGRKSDVLVESEIQPFFGQVFGQTGVDAVLLGLLRDFGIPANAENIFKLGFKLAMVAPDLLDGDRYLKAENRLRLQRIVLDLKKEVLK